MMFGLLDWIKLSVAALAGITLGLTFGYQWGARNERQEAAVAALERSLVVLKDRKEIDGQVSSADAADLCGSMGLSEQDRLECVRRLEQVDANTGNVGDDPEK